MPRREEQTFRAGLGYVVRLCLTHTNNRQKPYVTEKLKTSDVGN
jgi:hypothetical protein